MARLRYRLPKVDFGTARKLFSSFGVELRQHRARLLLSGIAAVSGALVTMAQPWPIKYVFDYVLMPGNRGQELPFGLSAGWLIVLCAAAVLVLAALRGWLSYVNNVEQRVVRHNLVASIRLRLFSHVQRLPQSYHDYKEMGELMTRITGDLNLVADLLVETPIVLTSQLLLTAGMLATMFWIDPGLGLIGVAIMPLFVVAAFKFSGRIRSSAKKQREAYGKIVAAMQESFSGISQVKAFAQEKKREKMVGHSVHSDARANVRTTKLSENYARTVELITALGTCVVLLVGAQRAMNGSITPGDVLVVIAYMRSMYRPLRGLAKLTTRAAKAVARGEKVLEVLALPAEVADRSGGASARDILGDIEFHDVTFGYTGGTEALANVSCRIPAGRTTLILGPSGAGKSTLAKLVLRLYEIDHGTVTLDGRDIEDYRIGSLRKRITPLTQDAFLFRATIAENISFAVRSASREDVITAATHAGAHPFITELPEGYDSLVGEGGATLSGGQRQRISLARAILRETPVMIFDEPATGLDVYSESETKDLLSRVKRGRTLLVITHRLHFLDLADWVVLIVDGRVVEQGPPRELLDSGGPLQEYVTGQRGATSHEGRGMGFER